MQNPNNRLVIDIETTGLTDQDEILEIAFIITDPKMKVEYYSASYLVHYSDVSRLRAACNERARSIHDANGLWKHLELAQYGQLPAYSLDTIGELIVQAIDYYIGTDGNANAICVGNNVESFDKSFLKNWIFESWQRMHYRTINVSSLREILRAYGVVLDSEGQVAHRALADCRSTINLYHTCLRELAKLEL